MEQDHKEKVQKPEEEGQEIDLLVEPNVLVQNVVMRKLIKELILVQKKIVQNAKL